MSQLSRYSRTPVTAATRTVEARHGMRLVAPSYLMSNSARAKMNFSDWNNFDQSTKAQARSLAASVVAGGEMPPWDFTLLHPSARLADSDKATIAQWAAAAPALPAH